MPRIELKNISKRFGRIVALQNVNLTIVDGEYVVILGPSGCGKTTLLNIISGVLKPNEGTVFIDGENVTAFNPQERHLSYVFQNIALFPHLSVYKNAGYSPMVRGLSKEEQTTITNQALELVDILDLEKQMPEDLPSGFQQKTALARAIATQAKLMILDEPLSALDPEVRMKLRVTVRNLVKNLNITAIHVTHDQDIAMSMADRIILMKKGSIIRFATPIEMYARPKSIFESFFVGIGNYFSGYIFQQTSETIEIMLRHEKTISIQKQDYFPTFMDGQLIVVFCRPENTIISDLQMKNSLRGVIKRRVFMGGYYRYEINTYTEDHIVCDTKLIKKRLEINTQVYIKLKPKSTLLFEQPKYGLLEELKLE